MFPRDVATVPRQALHNTFFCCTSVVSNLKYSHTTQVLLFFRTKLSNVGSGSAEAIVPHHECNVFLGFHVLVVGGRIRSRLGPLLIGEHDCHTRRTV